jgi:hypothetical protein
MGNSGTPWIDAIFDWAVHALDDLGTALDMSYELVNIVVFLGIGPVLVGFLIGWVARLRRQVKEAREQTDYFEDSLFQQEEILEDTRKELQKCRKALGNNA